MHDLVHFHGTYRYATRDILDRAIDAARAVLAEEEASDSEWTGPDTTAAAGTSWMRCFVTRGTVLTVNLTSRIDRFSAAAVFELLAEAAIEGAVEARLGDRHVDYFPSTAS